MPTPLMPPKPLLDSLAGYPHWFVAACLTLVIAALIWLTAKVLKWTLYAVVAVVLIGGIGTTIWLLFH